jgi:hypothetical protein
MFYLFVFILIDLIPKEFADSSGRDTSPMLLNEYFPETKYTNLLADLNTRHCQ